MENSDMQPVEAPTDAINTGAPQETQIEISIEQNPKQPNANPQLYLETCDFQNPTDSSDKCTIEILEEDFTLKNPENNGNDESGLEEEEINVNELQTDTYAIDNSGFIGLL
jgi:hypothetical protein